MNGGGGRCSDANTLIEQASALFANAPGNPKAAFRYPVLATVGCNGSPNGRVLVLRSADPVIWQATLHTDSRAEKVAELALNDTAMLVFYDHEAGVQLRLKGKVSLVTDQSERETIWAALPASNRPNYRSSLPTGTEIGTPDDSIDLPDHSSGFENFSVLGFTAETADILQLSRTGNRRYRLDIATGTGSWLVP